MDTETQNEPYVIIRTNSAGCFAGTLSERNGTEATMKDARRLWYWQGAASLSQLAVSGTSKPEGCKFPIAVPKIDLTGVLEVIYCTPEAEASIKAVAVWKA